MICPFGPQKHFSCRPISVSMPSRVNHLQLVTTDNFAIHSIVITSKERGVLFQKEVLDGRQKRGNGNTAEIAKLFY